MIGKEISPILTEIEATIFEFEINTASPPEYPIEGFRAAIKIFMSALLDNIWRLQQLECMGIADREKMAEKAGNDLRILVKTYTNIDTHTLYD
jgi:hypothetical protein